MNLRDLFHNGAEDVERQRLRERLAEKVRERFAAGATESELIAMLHEELVSIPEAIWILRQCENLPLDELKDRVTCHPAWQREVKAGEPLHDALEKAFSENAEE